MTAFIAVGPDGNMWFTDGAKIGRLTLDGALTDFAPPGGFNPEGIVAVG
ncbi:MAG TPA: hypothetical protein VEV38_06105 [Candidatus Eremiobacteraceae bacterium]|nr:hypothetical protein [Candidatus Eremiobacteraceae bacterium]